MGTRSCSDSTVSTFENRCGTGETLCNVEQGLLQVVHKRKERMTRRQTPLTTPEEYIPLFAGIPDDITIDHILTKLHWTLFNILTTVNRQWYHAIRSGKVYNARVRMQATETLIIISHLAPAPLNIGSPPTAISAYDPSVDQWHLLPPIPSPKSHNALPQLRGVVCLKGRLYIVTGCETVQPQSVETNQVFVLDFGAAARRWNKCRCTNADSASQRSYGAVRDVEDGKICVWGNIQI